MFIPTMMFIPTISSKNWQGFRKIDLSCVAKI
jgi:hypothetical protein